ncbi:MAG TPA: PQQ-binding-like beta-propeller repeat protein [Bryobacteraceae bacterium]|jgi:polyvinyl alcohol dehydrogenase (cytochrome)
MRYVCLLVLTLPVLSAQDGAAIYKERCASCHDMPQERVPSIAAIKAMSGEAVYVALTNGSMKSRAEGLGITQLFALIGYIAPTGGTNAAAESFTPTCKGGAEFRYSANSPQWNGWSTRATNSRFQDARAAGLTAPDVPRLKLKWAFNLGDVTVARSQPAVAGGRVFIATATGALYALDAATGCTYWGFKAAVGIRSGVSIGEANGEPVVFFGDGGANLYALSAESGKQIWKVHPADHFATTVTAAPRFYKGVVYQPFASFEEALGGDPKFECCTFRGSVVALDAATGKTIWQTFTIAEPAKVTSGKHHGPSGAAVWSSPTIDEQAGVLYVATGDNYSDPPTATSDAILAMDLKTGKLLWSKQLTENDAFNTGCGAPQPGNCPDAKGPDFDFGQPPILVSLGGGKRALVIGQKSGMAHAIDPDRKGEILWQTRAGQGSALGGSQWGSASDGRNVYVAISNIGIGVEPDPKAPLGYKMTLDPKQGGGLHALDLKTGKIAWSAKVAPCERANCSPAQSAAVTAIPGVVFSGSVDGHLRAYSASTGEVLWDTDTAREFETVNGKPAHGGALDAAGPAIVGGEVFVNSGYGQWGGAPGNALLVYSMEGK